MEDFLVLGNKSYQTSWTDHFDQGYGDGGDGGLFGTGHLWIFRNSGENRTVMREALAKDARGGAIVTHWHQDAMGGPAALILWSDTYPTEVLLPDGRVVAGKPNDFVLINNRTCKHRISPAYVEAVLSSTDKPRLFLRSILNVAPIWRDIVEWQRTIRYGLR